MALRDPREVERAVDDLRVQMSAIMADENRPEQDRRDAVMRMTGEMSALEVQARELREFELEQARAAVEGNKVVSTDAKAEQSRAFHNFITSGDIKNAALAPSPDANGGFLMPDADRAELIDVVRKINPIVAEATVFTMTKPGTYEIKLPRKTAATAGGWVASDASRPATDAPVFGQNKLTAHEWYAYPEVEQAFIDAVDNAEQIVIQDIADTFAATLGTGLAVGTGDANNQPTGIFTGSSFYGTKLSSTADSLDAAQIIGAYFQLSAKYLPSAVWMAKGSTLAALSALAWPNMSDTPLVRWENGVPTIMGKRVVISDDAPSIGNGAFPLLFGDVRRAYAVGIHSNVSVLRDPYTNKPYVGFYAYGRAGGQLWDPNAAILLKSDNA